MINLKLKSITLTFVLILLVGSNCVFALDQENQKLVLNFVDCVKSGNKQELIKFIRFPLKREYPLPSIKTPQQFLLRFDEVFDAKLTKIISNSTLNDWSEMGWRGIMLEDGILWLDCDGIVNSINYQSEIEKQKRLEKINAERKTLYSGLRNYFEPVLEWKTKHYRIRIDDLGDNKYRYASWPVNKETSAKPDLILNNGVLEFDGSGGNHYYEFSCGEYKYICYVCVIGTRETPPGSICVYKNDNLLLDEPVIEELNK